jgi:hypothetical protein
MTGIGLLCKHVNTLIDIGTALYKPSPLKKELRPPHFQLGFLNLTIE